MRAPRIGQAVSLDRDKCLARPRAVCHSGHLAALPQPRVEGQVLALDALELLVGVVRCAGWPTQQHQLECLKVHPPLSAPASTIRLVVIFRDARREDVTAIVALLADDVLGAERESAADEAYQAAFEQVQADPRSRLIVAEADGQVAGTLQLSMLPGLSRQGMLRAQIEGVRVAAPYRGRGLGRAMIEWAIGQAREHGCGLVQLTSDKRRHDAVRFYESLGFTASH
jgi:GNAT superfamily N-acetyltransferase